MAKIRVQVTEEDIQKGEPNSLESCPIALAFRRILCEENITVCSWDFSVRGEEYRLPIEAHDFVMDFDRKRMVEPFEFEVDID